MAVLTTRLGMFDPGFMRASEFERIAYLSFFVTHVMGSGQTFQQTRKRCTSSLSSKGVASPVNKYLLFAYVLNLRQRRKKLLQVRGRR